MGIAVIVLNCPSNFGVVASRLFGNVPFSAIHANLTCRLMAIARPGDAMSRLQRFAAQI
jgi:hypothetical protein